MENNLNNTIQDAMQLHLGTIFEEFPKPIEFLPNIRRAPKRELNLSPGEIVLALQNALRYIPEAWHERMSSEFLDELKTRGRIYGYRFRPKNRIWGRSIHEYKGKCLAGKACQIMIDNNLDFETALYPYELVTYGETGQVCQNWMQYQLIHRYLEEMNDEQTLVVASGHPLGLFHSSIHSPRVIITNALMIGMFDTQAEWQRAMALGVANYGQMTAGGWMYIGSQGIVHGTYNTLLNAGRLKLGLTNEQDLRGKLYVTSGLGGMSGAQGKAVEIAGGVGIIAEVDYSRIETRHRQGWVSQVAHSAKSAFELAKASQTSQKSSAIAFCGNIVDLLQYAVDNKIAIDLLSDQTSCHAVYDGGYCPQGISFEERTELLRTNKSKFCELVNISLQKHFQCIQTLVQRGAYFFDYGNAFMKAVYDAGISEICQNGQNERNGFIFPSYVEDIMGPMLFDYGYGPFRWVCLSGNKDDLRKTDQAAMSCINPNDRFQDRDNYIWIRDAEKNNLVVGTQARILYQDAMGRTKIALKFNEMIRRGEIGPIMIGRDHHDTGGTDSPFRETSNIKDGSNIMADMATQCFAGNCGRGMTLTALHNGGGVGIGKAINGGFGLLLDGSKHVDEIIQSAMPWDVMVGVARRSWARNTNSITTCMTYNQQKLGEDHITLPFLADEEKLRKLISSSQQ